MNKSLISKLWEKAQVENSSQTGTYTDTEALVSATVKECITVMNNEGFIFDEAEVVRSLCSALEIHFGMKP